MFDLAYNGPLQLLETRPNKLADSTGNGEGAGPLVAFARLTNPGGENRFKITVIFCASEGLAIPGGGIAQSRIWLHNDEWMDGAGASRGPFPVGDIVGTSTAGLLFPTSDTIGTPDAGLFGYSREFVSAADTIGVTVTFTDPGVAGVWYIKASLYPAGGGYYPWEAWDQLRRAFGLSVEQQAHT